MFIPLFCVVDLEIINDLMSAAEELMLLNRLLIVPGVEHAMPNIGVNLCSMMLQGSHIMSSAWIFWSTPPVHISSSSSRRMWTDRWVNFQQNAGLRLFVHTWIVHGIDDCYQLTRTFVEFSAQWLSKLLLFLLSGCPGVDWWWLLLRNPHSWPLSLTASSV